MNLQQSFNNHISTHHLFSPKDKLLLAVSGGVDSVVLCELCKQAGYDFAIAHCNFQLRGAESDGDAGFVKALAEKYGVPFYLNVFDTKAVAAAEKKSIEETARNLRYAWFHQLLEKEMLDWIVTGHHADDNIETMVMNFFRGTGIKGLRGMLSKNGRVVRPLLFANRKELEAYAAAQQLDFVTDRTNFENDYTRNFFRNTILPQIKEIYPAAAQNLLHNLARFAEAEELYEQAVAAHKKSLIEQKGNEIHIPVLKLRKITPLRSVVYEIISLYGFTAAQTGEVIQLLDSESGKFVASPTHRVIRNRAWLIISPMESVQANTIVIEEGLNHIPFAGGSLIVKETAAGTTLPVANTDALLDAKDIRFPLLLRKWKAGDYFYPLGMRKKKKIARFLIDLKLSKTDKEKVWVLESDKRILWVVGHRIDERFKVKPNAKMLLRLTFQNE